MENIWETYGKIGKHRGKIGKKYGTHLGNIWKNREQ